MAVSLPPPPTMSDPTITSMGTGSGLDLNGLLEKLQTNENLALAPITKQKAGYQAKISAFGQLQSALSSLQDASKALATASSYQAVSSNVSGDALTAATTSSTPPGDYDINVTQRAQASSVATVGVADQDANLGAGSVDFTLADGTSVSVAVDASNSSLADIRDAINAKDAGVRASIINDGSAQPYRLVLQASETGTKAAVSNVTFSGDLGSSVQLDASTQQAGEDAKLTINGIAITSTSNQVDGAIQGVTLSLDQTGEATLQVTQDSSAVEDSVRAFVGAYNGLVQTTGALTSYDAKTQTAGILLGNVTVNTVDSRITDVLTSAISGNGAFKTLSDFGVTLQVDGTLKVDDTKLSQAAATQPDDLSKFFIGTPSAPGMAAQLDTVLDKMTSSTGIVSNATASYKTSMDQLDDQYSEMQGRIAQTMSMYKTQFTQLDGMISQMNSTSTYLTQQFNVLNNIMKQAKS